MVIQVGLEERRGFKKNYIPAILIYFISKKSSKPYLEPSLPNPDSLIPPNGVSALDMIPVFIPTIPYSRASATLHIFPISLE